MDEVRDAVTGENEGRVENGGSGATPVAPDGGAGMKGAGAVGGSSATMASGSAGAGAPNPATGASNAGVTTGSEDKPQ